MSFVWISLDTFMAKKYLTKTIFCNGIVPMTPEKDINLIQMLANLIELGIGEAKKMCEIMDA